MGMSGFGWGQRTCECLSGRQAMLERQNPNAAELMRGRLLTSS